jgi:hypothetical protein
MTRRMTLVAAAGWLAFFVLAYCGGNGLEVDVRWSGDGEGISDAAAGEDGVEGGVEPLPAGRLSVVDADGRLVGLLVSRTHRLLEHNELFDGIQVYHPGHGLFFGIRMTDAQVLLPGKLFFSGGGCSGTAAVRALCPQCPSGFDLAFSYKGTWYRVPGGVERKSFNYSSYVADDLDSQCTGHGASSTHVYPLDTLPPGQHPESFTPPLRFHWAN